MPTLQEILQQNQQRNQQAPASPPPTGGQSSKIQDLLRLKQTGKSLAPSSGPQMSSLAEKQAGVTGQQAVQQQRGAEQIQQTADVQAAAGAEQQMSGQEAEVSQREQQIETKHADTLANLGAYFQQEGDKLDTAEAGDKLTQALFEQELASKQRVSAADISSVKSRVKNAGDLDRELSENRFKSLVSNTEDEQRFQTQEVGKKYDSKLTIARMSAKDKIAKAIDWYGKETRKTGIETISNLIGMSAEKGGGPADTSGRTAYDSSGKGVEQSGPAREGGNF